MDIVVVDDVVELVVVEELVVVDDVVEELVGHWLYVTLLCVSMVLIWLPMSPIIPAQLLLTISSTNVHISL